jgi:hypothetical protein
MHAITNLISTLQMFLLSLANFKMCFHAALLLPLSKNHYVNFDSRGGVDSLEIIEQCRYLTKT